VVTSVATRSLDTERAHLVADEYLDAPRVARDPVVHAAYRALAGQADDLFAHLTGDRSRRPVDVVLTRAVEPYAGAAELSESVRLHGVLEVVPSRLDRDRRHPLLDTSVGGEYDRFRAVHDIVSHGWLQHGFDRAGEHAAWRVEDRLYRGLARWALATELHAEHSVWWTSGDPAAHKAVLLRSTLAQLEDRPAGAAGLRWGPRRVRCGALAAS
jgi:hypothetical protein